MRILIAEDDFASRKFLYQFLSQYGECDLVVDGLETVDAFMLSLKDRNPYDLICLDIMMPKIDGVKVIKAIREMETLKGILPQKRAKVVMISALGESELVERAFEWGCDAYVPKPVDTKRLSEVIEKLGLLS